MEQREYGEIPSVECRREANELVPRQIRYKQILECLTEVPEMSAREIASMMCLKGYIPSPERNYSAPRINELCERGLVEQVGKKRCSSTGRTVTMFALTDFGKKAVHD